MHLRFRPALTLQAVLLFLVSLLPVLLLIGGINYQYTRQTLEEQRRLDLMGRTHTVEQTLANVLLRELERLATLARDPGLQTALSTGAPSIGSYAATRAAYEQAAATDRARLNYVETPAGQALKRFREQFPNRAVVLLTDASGHLDAVTTPAWPYWALGEQSWWPDVARLDATALRIGDPAAVPGLGTLLFLTAPVVNPAGQTIGAVAVGLNFAPLAGVLNDDQDGETIELLATNKGEVLFASPAWPDRLLSPAWVPAFESLGTTAAILNAPLAPAGAPNGPLRPSANPTSYLVAATPLRQAEGYGLDDPNSIRALNRLNWIVLRITPTALAFRGQETQLTLLAAGTIVATIVVLMIALITVRVLVTRPLGRLERAMDVVRKQGLEVAIATQTQIRLPQGNNEIGRLAQTFSQMLQHLNELMQERARFYVQQEATVERLHEMAARLSSTASEQQQITTSTSAALGQLLEAFGALDAAAVAIAGQASAVAAQAQQLQAQQSAGDTAVAATQHALTELQQTAQSLEAGAQSLAENASAAGALVEEADSIATTTHLLSLNAYIEAAGAGPYGLRFGAIAQEVRDLATAAANTAASVNTELLRMADQNRSTAVATAQARQAADSGASQLQVLVGMTRSLLTAADTLATNADQIRQWSETQRNRSNEVRTSSHQLASAMAQVTLASQEVAGQAQELLLLAGTLDRARQAQRESPVPAMPDQPDVAPGRGGQPLPAALPA